MIITTTASLWQEICGKYVVMAYGLVGRYQRNGKRRPPAVKTNTMEIARTSMLLRSAGTYLQDHAALRPRERTDKLTASSSAHCCQCTTCKSRNDSLVNTQVPQGYATYKWSSVLLSNPLKTADASVQHYTLPTKRKQNYQSISHSRNVLGNVARLWIGNTLSKTRNSTSFQRGCRQLSKLLLLTYFPHLWNCEVMVTRQPACPPNDSEPIDELSWISLQYYCTLLINACH